jgi:oligopeptide transport system substrate-binding protein
VVELERPTAYFLNLAASWPLFPLPAHVVGPASRLHRSSSMLRRDPQWTKSGRLVSNGPYRLAAWRFKGEVLLEANGQWHAAGSVVERSIRFVHFNDELAMFYAYESGALDVQFGATPLAFMPELLKRKAAGRRNDVHELAAFGTYYYAFNCRPKLPDGRTNPFADVRVRRAFAMTIDKRALVEKVTRLNQPVTSVFIPPGSMAGYESPTGLACLSDARDDAQRRAMIARARALLAEAGYPAGSRMGPVTFTYNTGGGHEAVAQAVADMWHRHLGVRVGLDGQEWKVYLDRRHTGDFMIARSGWFGDYGDPTTFLDLFKTGNGNNDMGLSDPKYDAMLEHAADTLDPSRRLDILRRAEAYVMADCVPIIPLYQYKLVHLFDPGQVRGVSMHPRNLQMYHRIEVRER